MTTNFESLLGGLSPQDKQQIATIPERFVRRALDNDWEGVAELYHPAAIQLPPDHPPVEGPEAIRRAMSQAFGAEGGVRLEDFAVTIREAEASEDLVYVRADYDITMSVSSDGGERISQRGPYINILRRDDGGRWLIYRQIYGRSHPPATATHQRSE